MMAHRHQSSLEGLIDFYAQQPPFADAAERVRATARFHRIVGHLEAMDCPGPGRPYNRPALVRLTFEYARSLESQDKFLVFFFRSVAVGMLDGDLDDPTCTGLRNLVFEVAQFLMTNFFLPFRASSNKTPQPSPAHHVALQHMLSQSEQQHMQDFVGTPERLSTFRQACLLRDRHRCVVSRAFNKAEAIIRFRDRGPAVDNDGISLVGNAYAHVEVAHIIPYGLTKSGDGRLDEPKQAAIIILNMFDVGVAHLIEGTDMHRPYNGITLSLEMHKSFGQYDIFFDHVPDSPPHTYRISTFLPPGLEDLLPTTRTLFTHPTIDPPSERLLALHRAVAHILHLSGAGDYINKILRDMEDGVVRGDGSTELGVLVDLALKVR